MSTTKEIMKELGLTRQRVCDYKKRGMPMEVGAAKLWLETNIKRKPRGNKEDVSNVKPLRKNAKKATPEDKAWEARLERAKTNEWETSQQLQSAIRGGKTAQIQPLLKAQREAVESVASIEKLLADSRVAKGDLIHRDTIKAVMDELLTPLRDAVDKLPLGERTNCNPQHPEIAERALKEWRMKFLKRVNAAEGRF